MTWIEVSLKEICDVDWGNTKLTKSSYVSEGKYLAVSAAGADGLIDHYEHEANVPVLSAIGAQCGRMFYPGARFTAIKNTITLTPKKEMADGKFLYYLFTHVELPQRGAGQPFISKGDIESFRVPIPKSLEKQREIVEKLDSAFAEIENARNQLRQRDDSFTRLEAGLIDERLSRNFESLIKKPLKEITSKIGSGATPRGGEESYKSEGIALIRSLNVYDDGFRIRKLARIDDIQAKALSNVEVQDGDVLLNITGASIARTCLAPQEYLPARVNQHVSIIRPKPEIILSKYLHFVLRSESMKNKLLGVGNSGGSTRQALTKVDLENTIIGFPSKIEDQIQAVDELNSLGEFSQTFKVNLLKMESLFSALANSLLSSAFSEQVA